MSRQAGYLGEQTEPVISRLLIRDDYGGYLSCDTTPAGVRQCLAHLYRYLDDACAIDPVSQVWTRQAGDALRAAGAAVQAARADGTS